MRTAGKMLMLVGAPIYVVVLATLHWYTSSTLWSEETLGPAITTGIAVIVAALAFAAFFSESVVLPALAVPLSFLLLGLSVFVSDRYDYAVFGPGYWASGAIALVMAFGGLLSFSGYVPRERGARAQVAQGGPPAAGWYEDPSGEAAERYWTGGTWSEHTR